MNRNLLLSQVRLYTFNRGVCFVWVKEHLMRTYHWLKRNSKFPWDLDDHRADTEWGRWSGRNWWHNLHHSPHRQVIGIQRWAALWFRVTYSRLQRIGELVFSLYASVPYMAFQRVLRRGIFSLLKKTFIELTGNQSSNLKNENKTTQQPWKPQRFGAEVNFLSCDNHTSHSKQPKPHEDWSQIKTTIYLSGNNLLNE